MTDVFDKKVTELSRDYCLDRVGVADLGEANRRLNMLHQYLREERPRDVITKASIFCHKCDRNATHEMLVDPDVPQILEPPTCMVCGATHHLYGLLPLLDQLGVSYR